MMSLEPGQIVHIHRLKSAEGKKLNQRRAIILRVVPDTDPTRYELLVEDSTTVDRPNTTFAVKQENIGPLRRRPLPSQHVQQRGFVQYETVDEGVFRTLTELLLRHTPDYSPPDTLLIGYAAMAFQRLGHENMMGLNCIQMEQVAGVLAIANVCEQGGVCACECAMFALLEGDPMCLDVICILIFQTPFFGPEKELERREHEFYHVEENALTPDQDSEAYCNFMETGPLLLFSNMAKWSFSSALFASIRRSPFYPQTVERFHRIIAREASPNPTRDGKRLGKLCRTILPHLQGSERV